MELREVTIDMYRDMTNFLLSGEWNAIEFCTRWIDRWEYIAQQMMDNDNISKSDYEDYCIYCLRRIMELCDTFHCSELYSHLVD